MLIPRLADGRVVSQLKLDAARLQKGFNGERKSDYHLRQLDDCYDVLCDVTLRLDGQPFQMDTVIISPYAVYIVGVKSLGGVVTFQAQHGTLMQEVKGKTYRYECPIVQAERHKSMLMKWLSARRLSGMPIYFLIGIAEMSTTIQMKDDATRDYVHYVEHIPGRIMTINRKQQHQKNIILQKKITSHMLQAVEDFQVDYLRKYNIESEAIKCGVMCKQCRFVGCLYKNGKFHCLTCGRLEMEDALQSLYDLMRLFKMDAISNKDAMKFLQLENRHQTLRVLRTSKLLKKEKSLKWRLPE